jgi:hypothetical protein
MLPAEAFAAPVHCRSGISLTPITEIGQSASGEKRRSDAACLFLLHQLAFAISRCRRRNPARGARDIQAGNYFRLNGVGMQSPISRQLAASAIRSLRNLNLLDNLNDVARCDLCPKQNTIESYQRLPRKIGSDLFSV